jgi:AcrR family transcriptional regulator
MSDGGPRWRRRKGARPGEIVEAAREVFAERGFAAAKLEEVARRAGVSKAALYLYFSTKEELFRAVAQSLASPLLDTVEAAAEAIDAPFAEFAPAMLARAAMLLSAGQAGPLARLVIAESRNFPDLARIWHDDVVARVLAIVTRIITRAQARGEVIPGDPRLHAFSLAGPMLMGALFREVFIEAEAPDLFELAAQHARTLLKGLLVENH